MKLPKLARDDALDSKDDREGHFYITWYDGRNKRRHPEPLSLLSTTLDIKVAKEFYLSNRKRAGAVNYQEFQEGLAKCLVHCRSLVAPDATPVRLAASLPQSRV